MCETKQLTFLVKQGCTWSQQVDWNEVGRKVVVPLALTLASPTSLSPLLWAFGVQLLGYSAQLARSPYVLPRDNRLAAASLFSVMCTLFFAGLLLSDAAGVERGVEKGKWLLLVLNVATLGALLGAVLLESLCESAAGQYLAARLWEALASRGLLGLAGAERSERTEPTSPAPTLAELELGKVPESDDVDFDDIEEGSDETDEEETEEEEEEIIGSSNTGSSRSGSSRSSRSRSRSSVPPPPPARRAMKPFGVGGARATPSAAARAQLRSSLATPTSTPPSTELTVAVDGGRGVRPAAGTNNPKVAKRPARSASSSLF